jgi:glycine cleavage system transcriptional repressor
MSAAPNKQYLAVSALGVDRPGLVQEFTRAISDCGGTVSDSRLFALGGEFGLQMLVGGNWHALARLETELARFCEAQAISLHLRRTGARPTREDHMPYTVDVVSVDHPGILSGLSGFFAGRGIDISEVATRSYTAAQTGAAMFAVQMQISVPTRLHVAQLREDFMDYCDRLNLDAILEPVKH